MAKSPKVSAIEQTRSEKVFPLAELESGQSNDFRRAAISGLTFRGKEDSTC
jgi:hypothetical protein